MVCKRFFGASRSTCSLRFRSESYPIAHQNNMILNNAQGYSLREIMMPRGCSQHLAWHLPAKLADFIADPSMQDELQPHGILPTLLLLFRSSQRSGQLLQLGFSVLTFDNSDDASCFLKCRTCV